MGVLLFWIIYIFMGVSFRVAVLNSQNSTCSSNDLGALEGFMDALESPIVWSTNLSSDCCKWEGITCNSVGLSARVVKLELGRRRLKGKLSESLASLDQLKTLNLSRNFLRGSLPLSLFHMPNLEILDLSWNDLSGAIPASFNLTSIKSLNISQNSFSGQVPAGMCNNSSQIRVINMAVNYLSGELPSGLGNCSWLQELCLGSNFLTGSIPDDVFRLGKLSRLILQNNKLSGQLSNGIGNLSNLVRLDVSLNMFSGTIPDVFGSLGNLHNFIAHSNFFTGFIPPSLSNSPTLTLLNLRNNSLGGHIDVNCSAMVRLESLDLGSNQFSGSIPGNLPSCHQLKNINLARNNFGGGQVPESFKNFHSLSYLSLSNSSLSNLSSALGILQHSRNLTTLALTLNFGGEELPSDPNLHFENLKVVIIASCRLSGSIPLWLRGCTKLQLLDLSWNRLDGTVPFWLGNFGSLFYIDLSNNTLTGEIPKNITGLPSLIDRNISFEEPSPDFSSFFIKSSGRSGLQYHQIWSFPPTVDLSSNLLSGPIWPEFGNLKKLHILDLKCNNLSGPVPSNLSGMTSLETLDLSHNNLSGELPSSLTKLTFMSKFSVAYNQLYGKIPSGGQFPTFPNSSFQGNKGFCHEHCGPVHHSPEGLSRRNKPLVIIIGMVVGIGFGTLLLLAFVIMLRKRHSHCGRQRWVDPEKEDQIDYAYALDSEQLRSGLVVMFKKDENDNTELCIDDIVKSTNNFDQANIIGCGGFGMVYKATLPDGKEVAIKRLSGDCNGQMEREFQAEVEALSRAQHPNLVLLEGYSMYKNDRLLIYSFMENSSLDYWLHENFDNGAFLLDWKIRLQIARGAARGLDYLHQSHIVHRDIKSSNILLDANYEAHLADFGLARLILPTDTHVTTDLVGTLGYIPPEYGQASVATFKGDIFSFGVVLLELLTGKRPMDMCKPRGCQDLISWVILKKKEKRESEVFDTFIYDKLHDKEMSRVLEIAYICISQSPKQRPSAQQLVSWLTDVGLGL